jgi:brefeldin A-resistance guanine nucleotide exchange factor 1
LGGLFDLIPFDIDAHEVDAVNLLNPFLEVIRSGSTTGPIAGTALGSVEKILHYGIVGNIANKALHYFVY